MMFIVQVDLLTGRYVASAYNDRQLAEWPPHPSRLYSALVATWAETGAPDDEGIALDTLASLPPPIIFAPEIQRPRDASTFYVPVNDASIARTYESNWNKMNDAWHEMERAKEALASVANDRERKQLETVADRSAKKISVLRETVAGFLSGGSAAQSSLTLLPNHRAKQPRHFPSVAPDDPRFFMSWSGADSLKPHLEALDRLLARVHRVGHSHSLVSVRRVLAAPEANWVPDEDGDTAIRWVGPGQRKALSEYHGIHSGVEPRVMPSVTIAYRRAADVRAEANAPTSLLAGDFIVYERVGGPSVPNTRAVALARTIHRALVMMAEQQPDGTVHPAVSGRSSDGGVTKEPHVLILPLPYVASDYADGAILGVAFVIPNAVSEDGRVQIFRALGRWEQATNGEDRMLRIYLGVQGTLEVRRALDRSDRINLQERTWCRASSTWITVTPIVLDRNPKSLFSRKPQAALEGERRAIQSIRSACNRIGLPDPERVSLERNPLLRGTEPVRSHPPFSRTEQGLGRVMVHARLEFPTSVRGPIVLGAGRFLGAGLLRPMPARGDRRNEREDVS